MDEKTPGKIVGLRARAEAALQAAPDTPDSLSSADMRQLLHELQVHQIELELQNEELRHSQDALEESRKRYMQLYHRAPVGYIVLNRVGIIKQANATFAVMTGMADAVNNVSGRPFADFLVPDDRRIFLARLKSFFKHPGEKQMQVRFGDSRQTRLIVSLEAAPLTEIPAAQDYADGEFFVVVSDITERAQAQAALQESEERWRDYVLYAPIGVIVADGEGLVQEVNPALSRLAGLDSAALLGKKVIDLYPDQERGAVMAIYQLLKLEGEAHGQLSYRHPRGEERRWAIAAARISEESSISFVEDITERLQLEAQRQTLQKQVNQLAKADSLGRMAAAIAHNFNNMLTVVVGNLEIGIDQLAGGPGTNTLRNSLQAAWKASELSRAMLTYLGQSSENREEFALGRFCAAQLLRLARAKPVAVRMVEEIATEGPIVLASIREMEQVVSHLLANAWEACADRPGKVTVRVGSVEPGGIIGSHRQPLNWQPGASLYAFLEVGDSGGGIAPADQERLFDPFFSTKFTGRGMGLPVVLGIVRAHGGVITVTSRLGVGTTIRVYLPAERR